MSLFRLVLILFVVVLLLPTDAHRQAELAGAAKAGIERAATFCERNPNSCATGRELWAGFVRKAEFGLELTARLARAALAGAEAPAIEPLRTPQRSNGSGRDTLSPADRAPEWRGRNARNPF